MMLDNIGDQAGVMIATIWPKGKEQNVKIRCASQLGGSRDPRWSYSALHHS
jgi:hypothetical protein